MTEEEEDAGRTDMVPDMRRLAESTTMSYSVNGHGGCVYITVSVRVGTKQYV